MASPLQSKHVATPSRESSTISADLCHDISIGRQVSTDFRAHLQSFTYRSANTTESVRATSLTSPTTDALNNRLGSAMKAEYSIPVRRSSRKRAIQQNESEYAPSTVPTKKKRTTTKQRSAADPYNPLNKLVDSIRPGLSLVFIGLNPGLTTAATGHAYAHSSNLFWKLLESSGVTPKRHLPSETHDLMDLYSIGNTNICARPTRTGDGLSKEELIEGAGILEKKIALNKPEAVCIVGKGIWEVIYKTKTGRPLKTPDFKYGWQDEGLWLGRIVNEDGSLERAGAKTFVATTTSGLAATMRPHEKLAVWKPLGNWVQEHRRNVAESEANVKTEAENIKVGKDKVKKEEDNIKIEEDDLKTEKDREV